MANRKKSGTKQVRETSAAKQVRAYVILNPAGKHVATVQAFYGSTVLVDCWHEYDSSIPNMEEIRLQQGRAGGGGYDKFAAALSGMVIDGHTMSDHCGARLEKPAEGGWPHGAKAPAGYSFANYSRTLDLYTDCYRKDGLNYLEAIGYRVICAI